MSRDRWDGAYEDGAGEVSWYQERPSLSLELIEATGAERTGGVIDIGGGASTLVDHLLDSGYTNLAVLDLSARALDLAKTRLGTRASGVEWLEGDVRTFYSPRRYAVRHDRAAFHFLTVPEDRQSYRATLSKTLAPGGHVVLATFAPDGPQKFSGLEVIRYDEENIQAELGPEFQLQEVRLENHVTPWESKQGFNYFHFRQCRK